MSKLVRDLMHSGVIACRPETPLGQVAVMLTQNRVHSLIVTDRDERTLGIITDFDLLAGEWLSADEHSLEVMRSMTAGILMSTPVNSIEADTPALAAAQYMRDHGISRLLVTEKGKRVGMLSVSDFVAKLADGHEKPKHPKTVVDVMSDAILVCRDKTPIQSVARTMTIIGWRSVLIVDASGKALGQVSGLDLVKYYEDDDVKNKTVSEVMHPALTIGMDATLSQAAELMIQNHYHRLIVVDPAQPDAMPLGMISSYDIVGEMARQGSIWQR